MKISLQTPIVMPTGEEFDAACAAGKSDLVTLGGTDGRLMVVRAVPLMEFRSSVSSAKPLPASSHLFDRLDAAGRSDVAELLRRMERRRDHARRFDLAPIPPPSRPLAITIRYRSDQGSLWPDEIVRGDQHMRPRRCDAETAKSG